MDSVGRYVTSEMRDPVAGRKIRWLGADVARICYARGTGETGGTVVSVYYTHDWRAAYLDYETY